MVDQEQADKYAEAARNLEKTVHEIFQRYAETKGAVGAGHDFNIVVEWNEKEKKADGNDGPYRARVEASTYRHSHEDSGAHKTRDNRKVGESLLVFGTDNNSKKVAEYGHNESLAITGASSPQEAKMKLCTEILDLFVQNGLSVVSVERDAALRGESLTIADTQLLLAGKDVPKLSNYKAERVATVVFAPGELG